VLIAGFDRDGRCLSCLDPVSERRLGGLDSSSPEIIPDGYVCFSS